MRSAPCAMLLLMTIALASLRIAASTPQNKIDAVMLTHKDNKVLKHSIDSALKYLVDVGKIYVISKDDELKTEFGHSFGPRVVFVDEAVFPFKASTVQQIFLDTVKYHRDGVISHYYGPLDGKTQFERSVVYSSKVNWYLQQAIKLYAGQYLNLGDYVVLDSDLVWLKDVRFIHSSGQQNNVYNYAPSNQFHPSYHSTVRSIIGLKLTREHPHYSGISHHIVFVKKVFDALKERVEAMHQGLPLWQVMMNQSAMELTCRPPHQRMCGAGSVLSEYELYFNYARKFHNETMHIRHLLWANGPRPGLLFSPVEKGAVETSDRSYAGGIEGAFDMQIRMDALKGYDFIGYHSYARRRYFELPHDAVQQFCGTPKPATAFNTTCSYIGLTESGVSASDWFSDCVCQNL